MLLGMAQFLSTTVVSQIYASSAQSGSPKSSMEVQWGAAVDEVHCVGPFDIVDGVTDVRLEPFSTNSPGLTTIQHIDLQFDGQVTVKLGTSSTEGLVLVPPTGQKARLVLDVQITRDASTGIFLTNSSGSVVVVGGHLSGT